MKNAAPLFLAMEASFPADHTLGARTGLCLSLAGNDRPQTDRHRLSAWKKNSRRLTRGIDPHLNLDRRDRKRSATILTRPARPGIAFLKSNPRGPTDIWKRPPFSGITIVYEDALRWIEEGRKRFKTGFAVRVRGGAIRENQRNFDRAIREYAKGAIAQSRFEFGAAIVAAGCAGRHWKPQIEQ